eukprot:GHVQ01023309.1.p1 GENE.GHVQ01023309.1~~GHVQ01023309.1.p1  ORF type:complete len:700 (+),score=67.50 GHVQ01023309.1:37-2136(+)
MSRVSAFYGFTVSVLMWFLFPISSKQTIALVLDHNGISRKHHIECPSSLCSESTSVGVVFWKHFNSSLNAFRGVSSTTVSEADCVNRRRTFVCCGSCARRSRRRRSQLSRTCIETSRAGSHVGISFLSQQYIGSYSFRGIRVLGATSRPESSPGIFPQNLDSENNCLSGVNNKVKDLILYSSVGDTESSSRIEENPHSEKAVHPRNAPHASTSHLRPVYLESNLPIVANVYSPTSVVSSSQADGTSAATDLRSYSRTEAKIGELEEVEVDESWQYQEPLYAGGPVDDIFVVSEDGAGIHFDRKGDDRDASQSGFSSNVGESAEERAAMAFLRGEDDDGKGSGTASDLTEQFPGHPKNFVKKVGDSQYEQREGYKIERHGVSQLEEMQDQVAEQIADVPEDEHPLFYGRSDYELITGKRKARAIDEAERNEAKEGFKKQKSDDNEKKVRQTPSMKHLYSRDEEDVPSEPLRFVSRPITNLGKKGGTILYNPPTADEARTVSKQGVINRGLTVEHNKKLLTVGAGLLKGKKLLSPRVHLRPMMSKVKGSIFSILQHYGLFDWGVGCRVLDLYSGSGAVAIEALSRGAGTAVLVDNSKDCCETAGQNLQICRLDDKARVIRATVDEVLRYPGMFSLFDPFDVVFVCPPYQEVVYSHLIRDLSNSPVIGDETVVIVEYPKEIGTLPPVRFYYERQRDYSCLCY